MEENLQNDQQTAVARDWRETGASVAQGGASVARDWRETLSTPGSELTDREKRRRRSFVDQWIGGPAAKIYSTVVEWGDVVDGEGIRYPEPLTNSEMAARIPGLFNAATQQPTRSFARGIGRLTKVVVDGDDQPTLVLIGQRSRPRTWVVRPWVAAAWVQSQIDQSNAVARDLAPPRATPLCVCEDNNLIPVLCASVPVSVSVAANAKFLPAGQLGQPWSEVTDENFRCELLPTLRTLWREGRRLNWCGGDDRELLRFLALGKHVATMPRKYNAAKVFIAAWKSRHGQRPHRAWQFIGQASEDWAVAEMRNRRPAACT